VQTNRLCHFTHESYKGWRFASEVPPGEGQNLCLNSFVDA